MSIMQTSTSPDHWVSESDIDNLFAENEIFFDEFESLAGT